MIDQKIDFELKRKAFHLCALIFPITYIFLPKITMCMLLLVIALITFLLDKYRHSNVLIGELVEGIMGFLMRKSEKDNVFSGSSYMIAGLLLSCVLFSKGLAIASWSVLIVADSVAALVGIRMGTKLSNGKSIEGSLGFLFSSIMVGFMSAVIVPYNTNFKLIIIASIAATFVEFFSKELQINDNFSIPLTYGLTTMIFGLI